MQDNHQLLHMYHDLMKKHMDLIQLCGEQAKNMPAAKAKPKKGGLSADMGRSKAACLGVVRLDYDYPPAPGDIDCPDSFGYDVYYRVVPGLTFDMCQGVSGITGDCGFMMYFQRLARQRTTIPVFMSSLAQLPAVTCAYNQHELIAILTANGETLAPMKPLIRDECGVDTEDRRYVIVGCENVPGFEAVAT